MTLKVPTHTAGSIICKLKIHAFSRKPTWEWKKGQNVTKWNQTFEQNSREITAKGFQYGLMMARTKVSVNTYKYKKKSKQGKDFMPGHLDTLHSYQQAHKKST